MCVVCAALSDKEGSSDVRLQQAIHLVRTVEEENRAFQVPVILGNTIISI